MRQAGLRVNPVAWRALTAEDLPSVIAIADRVHVDFPERPEVFAERLALWPEGAFALERGGAMVGYALAHPWRLGAPPKLDMLLGALPTDADTLFLHDIALLPAARGARAAEALVVRLAALAADQGLATISLVAVNGTARLWRRCRFEIAAGPALGDYGAAAHHMVRDLATDRLT